MLYRFSTALTLLLVFVILAGLSPLSVSAQTPDAFAIYPLNVRAAPDLTAGVLAMLDAGTDLFLEGRTADNAWLLVRTVDGTRGWVAELYVDYRDGVYIPDLPISDAVLAGPAQSNPAPAAGEQSNAAPPPTGDPGSSAVLREIFERGQARGNNPHLVTFAGDCNSVSTNYLLPIGMGNYNTPEANPAISFFMPSFTTVRSSHAAGPGYTAPLIVDSAFSPPDCPAGSNPLVCEFMTNRPSFIIVNFGINDILSVPDDDYINGLSMIVELSKIHGVIPIFTTFPIRQDDADLTATAYRYNGYIKGIAGAYGIPVIDLQGNVQGYPNGGLQVDYIHLSADGYHMWNYLVVRKLAELYQELDLSRYN